MHELPIIKNVLKIVLDSAHAENAKQVKTVALAVGEMHDLIPELVEKYFAYVSRGTIAEGAELVIKMLPVICVCNSCGEHIIVHMRRGERTEACPACGGESLAVISGDELAIDNIEIY